MDSGTMKILDILIIIIIYLFIYKLVNTLGNNVIRSYNYKI